MRRRRWRLDPPTLVLLGLFVAMLALIAGLDDAPPETPLPAACTPEVPR